MVYRWPSGARRNGGDSVGALRERGESGRWVDECMVDRWPSVLALRERGKSGRWVDECMVAVVGRRQGEEDVCMVDRWPLGARRIGGDSVGAFRERGESGGWFSSGPRRARTPGRLVLAHAVRWAGDGESQRRRRGVLGDCEEACCLGADRRNIHRGHCEQEEQKA